MSQGPAPPRAIGHSLKDTNKNNSPGTPKTLPPIQDDRLPNIPRNTGYMPPILQRPSGSSTPELSNGSSTRPAGPVGMQNLLNPSGQDTSKNSMSRRSADCFDPPSMTGITTPQLSSSKLSQSPSNSSLPSLTPPSSIVYPSHAGQPPRRILTPHTPSIYGMHTGTVGLSNGTIDAAKSPFLGCRELPNTAVLSGHALSMVPRGPAPPHPSSGVPPTFNRSPPGRRSSGGALQLHNIHERRASAGGQSSQPPASQSNSPSTSYSPYSRFSGTPPAPHAVVATNQPASFFAPHHEGKVSIGSSIPPNFEAKETFGRVAGSMGHSTLQLMTLDTEQGPIQVPVDVTAASKVADEKRKRNATASHRFRQRRKEKERETSQNIAKLEHRIRELAEERDYYRLERDFFRSVASSEQGLARLPPRPPSPRQVSLAQLGGENDSHEENNRHGRNTRRRTSAYEPATDIIPPVNAGPPQIPRYGSMTSNPSENADQRSNPSNRPPLLGPSARPFDPATHGQYSRGWKTS